MSGGPGARYPGFSPRSELIDGIRVDYDVSVKMRDGITLYTDDDLFVYVRKLDKSRTFAPAFVLGHPHPGAQGWLRVSHREIDPNRSTESEPCLSHQHELHLKPEEIVPVDVPIWPTSMVCEAGEYLELVIAGRGTLVGLSLLATKHAMRGCTCYTAGADHCSYLLLPVIPPRQ